MALAYRLDAAAITSLNNIDIASVDYEVNRSGVVTNETQSSSAGSGPSSEVLSGPVRITGIKLSDSTYLDNFNTGQVQAVNLNLPSSGLEQYSVIDGGNRFLASNDLLAYRAALQSSVSNENLLNYIDQGNRPVDPPNGYDFDIIFRFGLTVADYLVVGERNGNSFLRIQALDANGDEISGAALEYQASSGTDGSPYQEWNTGFGASGDPNSRQPLNLSVVSAGLFFDSVAPETIFGLRVYNTADADIKVLASSSKSFTSNPQNPLFPVPVPEPASFGFLLGLICFIGCLCGRRERR